MNNFLFQYRNTPHSTTGESPAKLLLQRCLRCVFDLLKPNTEDVVENNQCKQVSKFKDKRAVSFDNGENVNVTDYRANHGKWQPAVVSEHIL